MTKLRSTRAFVASSSLVLALASLLVACARSAPLPGDSVADDGAVNVAPGDVPLAKPQSALPAPGTAADAGARSRPASELGAIEARVFSPELVMEHQIAIGLRPEQLAAIRKEVERGQQEMVRIQWDLAREKEKLASLLEPAKVDEGKVKEAAAALMKHENTVKAAHLGMLVRLKNHLTPEQQDALRALRAAR